MYQELSNLVIGGLRDCIKSHGVIDKNLIGSASKRIVGAVHGYLQTLSVQTVQDIELKKVLADKDRIIQEKSQKIVKQGKIITDLLEKLKAHGVEV